MRKFMAKLFPRLFLVASVITASLATPGAAMAQYGSGYSAATATATERIGLTLEAPNLLHMVQDSPSTVKHLTFTPSGSIVKAELKDGQDYDVTVDDLTKGDLEHAAYAKGVPYSIQADPVNGIGQIFGLLQIGLLVLGAFMVFSFMRSMRKGGGIGNMTMGKSRARLVEGSQNRTTFADVAGQDEAKEELAEFVKYLKNPEKYKQYGAKIPKGALMVGPSGTGKTLLARAVAGEANVPFYSISGSDFVEMFVGVGASRVRDMAAEARKHPSAIIFIDEIDAVGKARHGGGGPSGGNDEKDQTLNQLLVEIDGFDKPGGTIIWLAATNRPEILDPALVRAGRLTRKVHVSKPDRSGRLALLKLYLPKLPRLHEEVMRRIEHFVGMTPGLVGADFENGVNEAALMAARRSEANGWAPQMVTAADVDEGFMRAAMGPKKEGLSKIMTEATKRTLAVHEMGHTCVAMESGQKPGRVTIMPRGDSGGHFQPLAELDETLTTREQLTARIRMALAGKAAQQHFEKRSDSGCMSDLQVANETAQYMVTKFGMSKLGSIYVQDANQLLTNPELASRVQAEVERIVAEQEAAATAIIVANQYRFTPAVEKLLEVETLQGPEIEELWNSIPKPEADAVAVEAEAIAPPTQPEAPVEPPPAVSEPVAEADPGLLREVGDWLRSFPGLTRRRRSVPEAASPSA